MAIENIACPSCNDGMFVTIPMGQRLLKVWSGWSSGYHGPNNVQNTKCPKCGKSVYAETELM